MRWGGGWLGGVGRCSLWRSAEGLGAGGGGDDGPVRSLSRSQHENVRQQRDDSRRDGHVLERERCLIQIVESPDDDRGIDSGEDEVQDEEDANVAGCHISSHRVPG